MSSPKTAGSPSFDASVRNFSLLSLAITIALVFIRFAPPERGIQFGTHMLLLLGFIAQLGLFALLSVVAIFLRLRQRLICARLTALLAVLAIVGLSGQFFALQTVAVDGSSVP